MGTDVDIFGRVYSYSKITMTCNLHIGKLLKRQSKNCDSAQFVVHDENRPVYVLLPFHPQGPSRVPWKSKKKTKKHFKWL